VKNNLKTMTGLPQLRGRQADAATRALLDDVAGRVRALGAVQARIYETEDLDRVDFRAALEDIARSLTRAHGNGSVRLAFSADGSPQLKVDRAMPLALLCHELVLNALKHAWPEGRKGRLRVTLRAKGRDRPEIVIADDGVGFADDAVARGTGLRPVQALAAEAQVAVETVSRQGDGATVTLRLA
jgi:two-component sensor histidine kinase